MQTVSADSLLLRDNSPRASPPSEGPVSEFTPLTISEIHHTTGYLPSTPSSLAPISVLYPYSLSLITESPPQSHSASLTPTPTQSISPSSSSPLFQSSITPTPLDTSDIPIATSPVAKLHAHHRNIGPLVGGSVGGLLLLTIGILTLARYLRRGIHSHREQPDKFKQSIP